MPTILLQDLGFDEFKISCEGVAMSSSPSRPTSNWPECLRPPAAHRHHGSRQQARRHGEIERDRALARLLWAGIGDTLRVSLSADEPEEEVSRRVGDAEVDRHLRHRGVKIISCPSCARQGFDVIRTVEALEKRLEHIQVPITLSIIGCVVNGPGEALMTDLGVTGGGAGKHMVYRAGSTSHTVEGSGMIEHVVQLVEAKAAELSALKAAAE